MDTSSSSRGLALGVLGVFIFALSIPMTRLASGSAADPQLPAVFVAIGRAAVAGVLAAAYLAAVRAPWPRPAQWPRLALTAAGVVFGWPLFLGWAVLRVDAIHASVISGVLPLATAAVGAWALRQRPSAGFWACALLGCALVVGFAAWRGGSGLQLADGLLLLAVLSAAIGYVSGARLSGEIAPQQVISWVLVMSLPLTVPVAIAAWPSEPVRASAWGGFAYVAVFSMWLGFFAWYRALALGGTLRVSQVQLLQPFLSMLLAVPLLGETLDAATMVFALAVMAAVALAKRMPVGTPAHTAPQGVAHART
ncbi:MAG TPA: DMT family transporter [Burkholderiaceae bacterium]|nr:DMT family transporter [Burkholderiaceae bacterium]